MARYSAVLGPTGTYSLTTSYADVPQMTKTRSFDEGPVLIAFNLRITGGAIATEVVDVRLLIDGAAITPYFASTFGKVNTEYHLSCIALIDWPAGTHEVKIQARKGASGTDALLANSCYLTLIQLPLWDDVSDVPGI